MVDGWNAWYFNDLKRLVCRLYHIVLNFQKGYFLNVVEEFTKLNIIIFQSKKWTGYGKNKESLAELWIGLLKFFTEEFNFKDYVVSIRHHKPLTRFEKLWNGKGLAIEGIKGRSHARVWRDRWARDTLARKWLQ